MAHLNARLFERIFCFKKITFEGEEQSVRTRSKKLEGELTLVHFFRREERRLGCLLLSDSAARRGASYEGAIIYLRD